MPLCFPPPHSLDTNEAYFISEDISCDDLLQAYPLGYFPWPQDEREIVWAHPKNRGILHFTQANFSRSFHKWKAKMQYTVTINKNFPEVMKQCQKSKRPGQNGTWITQKLLPAYTDLHKAGFAHSVECWQGDELIGGLYGVDIKGAFCGESMFYKQSNASKLCLWQLIKHLEDHGRTWMDIQMLTPSFEDLGGTYIARANFLGLLVATQKNPRPVTWKPKTLKIHQSI